MWRTAGWRRRIDLMVPMLEFVDCTPTQIGARIDKMMRNRPTQTVVVRRTSGESVIGTYESADETDVVLEIDATSQSIERIPTADVSMFGQYVPPLNFNDEIGERA